MVRHETNSISSVKALGEFIGYIEARVDFDSFQSATNSSIY